VRRAEEGFTLVELILTIVIGSIVMGAISASIVVGLRTSDTTQTRLSESHDAQMTAAYFVGDVHSSDYITLADIGCVQAGESRVVTLEWYDGTYVRTAAYFVHTDAGSGERRLSRRMCSNDVSTGTTTSSVIPISHNLAAGTDPSVTCDGSACPATGNVTPSKVVIDVTDAGGYAYELSGSRRVT
jgi:prepilin-type N-terminal cleavage/methylation domain-containing protein